VAQVDAIGMVRIVMPVEGMTCASCSARVGRALSKVEGVESANVNFATHRAAVSYDPALVDPAAGNLAPGDGRDCYQPVSLSRVGSPRAGEAGMFNRWAGLVLAFGMAAISTPAPAMTAAEMCQIIRADKFEYRATGRPCPCPYSRLSNGRQCGNRALPSNRSSTPPGSTMA
jgi:copper chaperone CopZ